MAADGKCFDVAIDHMFFNEPSFLSGIEDIRKAIETVITADPDAILGVLTLTVNVRVANTPGTVRRPSTISRRDSALTVVTDSPDLSPSISLT